jgi:HD-like signal output (HDOD) protein
MRVQDLLNQTNKLPNVPEVVRELIQALNDPKVDSGKIAKKVSADQTLSLKILRLVNSAHFGLSRKVSSIEEATVMLGMEKLKTLVIASGFAGSAPEVEGMDVKAFWSESFQVATIAKWFAKHTKSVEEDIAFTTGIIHNIGRLLLHLAEPNRAKAIQTLIEQTKCSRSAAEMERLTFTTQDAGKALLDMWKFPPELGNAVKEYKKPLEAEKAPALAAVMHLACYINASIRDKRNPDLVKEQFPLDVAEQAGINSSVVDELDKALALESGLDGLNG